ncbi:MAG: hypothetical protein PHT33_13130, partial [bacterium]|nr:hypothetical protein [bacterium]
MSLFDVQMYYQPACSSYISFFIQQLYLSDQTRLLFDRGYPTSSSLITAESGMQSINNMYANSLLYLLTVFKIIS